MTDEDLEHYHFLRLCSIDLDTAAKTISILRRYRRDDVRAALLRDIAVTYARSFSGNQGNKGKHRLPGAHIPESGRALHNELIKLRNCQLAHSNLRFHSPRVALFAGRDRPLYFMSFRSFDYRRLLARLPTIEALIKAVEQSVNEEVRHLEEGFNGHPCQL